MSGERLSRQQRGWLWAIDMLERHGEEGSDASGDLSVRTGNYAATHYSLIRRGLVTAEYDSDIHPEDGPWIYRLTQAGKQALEDADA